MKYFFGNGFVDGDIRDGLGYIVLYLVVRFGRFDIVKWLIERGNSNLRVKFKNYMILMYFVVFGGYLICLELLVFKVGYRLVL